MDVRTGPYLAAFLLTVAGESFGTSFRAGEIANK